MLYQFLKSTKQKKNS